VQRMILCGCHDETCIAALRKHNVRRALSSGSSPKTPVAIGIPVLAEGQLVDPQSGVSRLGSPLLSYSVACCDSAPAPFFCSEFKIHCTALGAKIDVLVFQKGFRNILPDHADAITGGMVIRERFIVGDVPVGTRSDIAKWYLPLRPTADVQFFSCT